MSSTSHLPDANNFSTLAWRNSKFFPGVQFAIRRMSLAQRIELTRRVRELTIKNDFLRCGGTEERLDATLGDLMARRLYLEWGLSGIEGLRIDGKDATAQMLIEHGPERLAEEAVAFVMDEIRLNEEEIKNS